MQNRKSSIKRRRLVLVLGGCLFVLILLQYIFSPQDHSIPDDYSGKMQIIQQTVDDVLYQFGIQRKWIKNDKVKTDYGFKHLVSVNVPEDFLFSLLNLEITRRARSNDFDVVRVEENMIKNKTVFSFGEKEIVFVELHLQKTSKVSRSTGKIAIIIDDFGYNKKYIDDFLKLSAHFTVAIIPGHRYSKEIAQKAKKAGKEVIIHMPMEPIKYQGGEEEYILRVGMTPKNVEERLAKAFKEIPQAKGINNHQGSRATSNEKLMKSVMPWLKKRGLYFVDSRTTEKSVAYSIAQKIGIPADTRSVFLDNDETVEAIRSQLDELVQKAVKRKQVIGIGHAKENTLLVLSGEIPKLQKKGFEFVFASELFQKTVSVISEH